MNHRKLVEETAEICYCSKKDLPDLIVYELKRMGLSKEDMAKCREEINNYMKENND